MDVERSLARRVHRLADCRIGLEVAAIGRIADRKIIAVAAAHAERPVAAAHRLRDAAAIGLHLVTQLVAPGGCRRAPEAEEANAAAGSIIGALQLVDLGHDRRTVLGGLRPEKEKSLA